MNLEIANRLLQLRKQHHLSQEELAQRLGISRQAVSKWERAEASPDTDNLILLARLYQVSLDDLLLTSEPVEPVEPEAQDRLDEGVPGGEENREKESCGEEEPNASFYFDHGLHVKEGKNQVHLGPGYLHVRDENGEQVDIGDGRVYVNGEEKRKMPKSPWHLFPYPILAALGFLVWGFFGDGWGASWVMFLTIPLYYTLVEAVEKRDPVVFCFPVLSIIGFYLWGYYGDAWNVSWVLLLSIPVYYVAAAGIKKKERLVACYPVLVSVLYVAIGFTQGAWHPWWLLFLTIPLVYGVVEMVRARKSRDD